MYRAVSLFALRNELIQGKKVDIERLRERLPEIEIAFVKDKNNVITLLNGENVENEIRGVAVSAIVSEISKIKHVRQRLVQLQHKMEQEKGLVMDGRDIGTVVFPQAEIKLFMKADAKIRARRRYDELKAKGIEVRQEDITANIRERDYQDMHRTESPLVQAEDSYVLDNSIMTFDEQMEWFLDILKKKQLLELRHGDNN
jgi:cytidylate kinase